MRTERDSINVRVADLAGPDNATVSRLVEEYLKRTEFEKARFLGQRTVEADLPMRYRSEVEDPSRAYENASVYLGELNDVPVGVVVVRHGVAAREIKRVWVDPKARGHRVGSALIDAAVRQRDLPLRLSVWEWREDAVKLYRKRGFIPVVPWDDRPRLLCMELREVPAAGVR